ncbi:hypothetical protein GCM10009020_19480 [Natronoarchaeum mannanilyticum]|uniref:Uncharacterized protein n=1 Tax=Natronoarchaeum mannanilyticum TaxID=926360 RepID=A0AAV3TA24_9EURY
MGRHRLDAVDRLRDAELLVFERGEQFEPDLDGVAVHAFSRDCAAERIKRCAAGAGPGDVARPLRRRGEGGITLPRCGRHHDAAARAASESGFQRSEPPHQKRFKGCLSSGK